MNEKLVAQEKNLLVPDEQTAHFLVRWEAISGRSNAPNHLCEPLTHLVLEKPYPTTILDKNPWDT